MKFELYNILLQILDSYDITHLTEKDEYTCLVAKEFNQSFFERTNIGNWLSGHYGGVIIARSLMQETFENLKLKSSVSSVNKIEMMM